jgi:hypothetical protein
MAWWRIICAAEIATQARHQAHGITQKNRLN